MKKITRKNGFTLLEALVSMIIFGAMGVATMSFLISSNDKQELILKQRAKLQELQKVMLIISRDFIQMVPRATRNTYGDLQPVLKLDGVEQGLDTYVEFTRAGWRNPTSYPRSELQHVAYKFVDEKLLRAYWSVLDRSHENKANIQVLLEDVEAFSVGIVMGVQQDTDFADLVWEYQWPLIESKQAMSAMPAAVKVSIVSKSFGDVTRVFPLVVENQGSRL